MAFEADTTQDIMRRVFDATLYALSQSSDKAQVFTATLQDAVGANGNGTSFSVSGLATIALQVIITDTATVNFEATINGTNWVQLNGINIATPGTTAETTTASGIFLFDVSGLAYVRARVSNWTAGTVTVTGSGVSTSAGGLGSIGADPVGLDNVAGTQINPATEDTLSAASAKLPATLGQKASAASLASVLSTEQEVILTALKTALEILDNVVSGNEAQVDVVTLPSVAQATHDNLNANTNIQINNTDVSQSNPVPVELNDKSSVAVGSQQTNVDNVSNVVLAEIDLADASWHDFTLEVKIIQAAGDESALDFILFWGFCSIALTTNAPTQLATSEYSLICDLTTGSTTRYYMTPILQPKARYLSVWYDCNNVTVPLTSVDVTINKLT